MGGSVSHLSPWRVKVLKIFSDPKKIEVLQLATEKPVNTYNVPKEIGISSYTASRWLREFAKLNLIGPTGNDYPYKPELRITPFGRKVLGIASELLRRLEEL